MNPDTVDLDELTTLGAAVKARHELATTVQSERGFYTRFAACTCGETYDWDKRQAEHDLHVIASIVAAVVDHLDFA